MYIISKPTFCQHSRLTLSVPFPTSHYLLQSIATVISNFSALQHSQIVCFCTLLIIIFQILFKNLVIHHNHETRLKASNAITTAKFKTNKEQRSVIFGCKIIYYLLPRLWEHGFCESKVKVGVAFVEGAWCWRSCQCISVGLMG